MTEGKCVVCSIETSKKCGACGIVLYCNRDHQLAHWTKHKSECCPVKVNYCQEMGRYLVAARNINEGSIMFKEKPFILGPKVIPLPVCVGCHREFEKEETVEYCKCGWPVCGVKCSISSWHSRECKTFQKSGCKNLSVKFGEKDPSYSILTPLRCLLLSSQNKEKLNSLQSHLEQRIRTTLYQAYRKSIVPAIRETLKMPCDENDILKICGILDTNTFDIRTGRRRARGLYYKSSLMAHDCRPNTRHVFDEETLTISIIATRNISKGESVTATYTQSLWDTARRRAHLKIAKCFDCTCERCSDPTEFGTFASSILCCNCRGPVISIHPLEMSSDWKCSNCNKVFPEKQIVLIKDKIRTEICSLNLNQIEELEEFLIKHKKILHETNSFILEISYALTQLYNNLTVNKNCERYLKRRIELCRFLLKVAEKIDPGTTKWKGQLMFSLQDALVQYQLIQNINKQQKNKTFNEAKEILEEATKILQIEPEFLSQLNESLSNLKSLE